MITIIFDQGINDQINISSIYIKNMNRESEKKGMKDSLYYLAHPYTAKENRSVEDNVKHCIDVANDLMDRGYTLYVPIVMTHYLEMTKSREYQFWLNLDKRIMERCDGIILSGNWKESNGCLLEKRFCEKHKKEILFYKDIITL
jgi:hypothetical protein